MVENQKVKIGIIGTGRIAKRFLPELQTVNGMELAGVYTPHIESGQAFANQYQIPYWEIKEEFFTERMCMIVMRICLWSVDEKNSSLHTSGGVHVPSVCLFRAKRG